MHLNKLNKLISKKKNKKKGIRTAKKHCNLHIQFHCDKNCQSVAKLPNLLPNIRKPKQFSKLKLLERVLKYIYTHSTLKPSGKNINHQV
jgi:hypothetical protein